MKSKKRIDIHDMYNNNEWEEYVINTAKTLKERYYFWWSEDCYETTDFLSCVRNKPLDYKSRFSILYDETNTYFIIYCKEGFRQIYINHDCKIKPIKYAHKFVRKLIQQTW